MVKIVKLDRKPVESKQYPGYYHVPDFSRYVVREDGDMINVLTGNHITQRTHNAAGYHLYNSLRRDDGVKRTVLVSRLLKMTFDPVEDMDNLVVDHINNNTHDNRLCNLNWTDTAGNIAKAGRDGLMGKRRPVLARNYSTKQVIEFPTVSAACKHFNLPGGAMRYRLGRNDSRVYPEGYQYKYKDSKMSWADYEDYLIEEDNVRYGHARRCMVRNIQTGDVYHFDNIKDAAEFLGMPPSSLSNYIHRSTDLQPVLPGLMQFKYENDLNEWIDYDDPYLELVNSTGDRLIRVVDTKTGEIRMYKNQLDCCRDLHMKPSALNNRLKLFNSPGHVFKDGLMMDYYPPRDQKERPKNKVQRPSEWSRARIPPETPST